VSAESLGRQVLAVGERDRASGQDAPPVVHRHGPGGEPGDATFRHSYAKDRQLLLRRLARMEGQVRGISRMIQRDEYCIDILQQTAALRAAVDAIAVLVLEDHVAGCLRTAVETGDAAAYTDEVMDVVRRMVGRPVRATPRGSPADSSTPPEGA
jgi:CsoR family transcriptional regulator, copper-sensing transcriptional repressor